MYRVCWGCWVRCFHTTLKIIFYCWSTVYDEGPTLNQHFFNLLRCREIEECVLWNVPSRHTNLNWSWSTVCDAGPALYQHWMSDYPANTRHWSTVVLMLARRPRRRPNIKTTVVQSLVFAGWCLQELTKDVFSGVVISVDWYTSLLGIQYQVYTEILPCTDKSYQWSRYSGVPHLTHSHT